MIAMLFIITAKPESKAPQVSWRKVDPPMYGSAKMSRTCREAEHFEAFKIPDEPRQELKKKKKSASMKMAISTEPDMSIDDILGFTDQDRECVTSTVIYMHIFDILRDLHRL